MAKGAHPCLKTRLLVMAFVAAVAVAGLVFVLHHVPFYAPSFIAWTGSAAALSSEMASGTRKRELTGATAYSA